MNENLLTMENGLKWVKPMHVETYAGLKGYMNGCDVHIKWIIANSEPTSFASQTCQDSNTGPPLTIILDLSTIYEWEKY